MDGKVCIDKNARWARNVANHNPHSSGTFVLSIAYAYLRADNENRAVLDTAVATLREKYPKWDIEERS